MNKKMVKKIIVLFIGAFIAIHPYSLTPLYAVNASDFDIGSLEEALDTLIPDAPPGTISWQTLGQTKVMLSEDTGDVLAPSFPKEIQKLAGTTIEIVGFLFPIETAEKQTHFLLSALPPSCQFCLPAGPNYIMDVKTKKAIKFSYDPIRLKGTFQILNGSDEFNLFYKLTDAELVE